MKNVFISYAKEDQIVAKKLYRHLKEAGLEAWLDSEDLIPGQRWKYEIKKAISNCDYFVALLSSNSVNKRGYVQKELKIALDVLDTFPPSDIFLIPVRLDDCQPTDERLSEIHRVDLFPFLKGFKKLVKIFGVEMPVGSEAVTSLDRQLLQALHRTDGITRAEVIDRSGIKDIIFTGLLKLWVSNGLISIEETESAVIYRLTDKGERIAKDLFGQSNTTNS